MPILLNFEGNLFVRFCIQVGVNLFFTPWKS